MASLFQEIENNEALLLMFLSGELLPDDQAEVQQMLAADSGLRAEYVKVQSAYECANVSLGKLDADRTAVAGENHAIRQAQRAMRQWQIDRSNRPPTSVPMPVRRLPAWMYPSAVAALLLIGTLTYWGIVGESGTNSTVALKNEPPATPNVDSQNTVEFPTVKDETATARLIGTLTRADSVEQSFGHVETTAGIEKAENQASTLMARSDNASDESSVARSIFLDDTAQ